jgi:hypothetical protein
METTGSEGITPGTEAHRSPSLLWLAVIYVSLFLASLVVSAVMTDGARYPSPFQSGESISRYFNMHSGALRLSSFLQFGAAIPLGLYSATVSSRLRFLGIDAAGTTIAQFGGFTASAFLALSGLISWVLSQPDMSSTVVSTRTLELLSFATGGPGHIVTLGLLLAGVSVPGLILKLLPRWVAILGLLLAFTCELSTFSLIFYPAALLLPIGRFGSLVWLVATGSSLPKGRTRNSRHWSDE